MNRSEVMGKRSAFSGVPAALVLCIATALSANAHASSYAVSTNTISNFGMTFSPSTSFTGFTFSSDSATQGNVGTGNAAGMDAPASCINCGHDNSFVAHGMGPDYSYGDARITDANVLLGAGSASAIGESSISNGIGSGYGNNTMIGMFSIAGSTNVSFHFDATPYLLSQLTAGGQLASANTTMTVSIDGANGNVFTWAPNGQKTGLEIADDYNLNWGVAQGGSFTPGTGHYANSVMLNTAGLYSLNISMSNYVAVSSVPVPAAAWLLGSGLIGLVGIARRKVG